MHSRSVRWLAIALAAAACSRAGTGGGGQPSPPAAPTGVVATPGDGQVTVAWTATQGATSYNLYWSSSAGVSKASGTKVPGVTSGHVVTGLTNGTAYYFVVTAQSSAGESAESSPAASATPFTGHVVTISWAPNRESGVNRPGGGYRIAIPGRPVVDVPYVSGSLAPTSQDVTLAAGTYTVTITAYAALDAQGGSSGSESAPSQAITVTVP